jgi:hypothetical protein
MLLYIILIFYYIRAIVKIVLNNLNRLKCIGHLS